MKVKVREMFDNEIDDMLGGSASIYQEPLSPAPRRGGRPKGSKTRPKTGSRVPASTENMDIIGTQNATTLLTGVPIPTLIRIFRMGRGTILEALKNLEPVKLGHNGAPYYDLAEAASYLVAPKVDVVSYIKRMDPDDLPDQLKSSYWNAKLQRQKFEENAGDLWRSEDVMQVLSDTFKIIKDRSQLFVQALEGNCKLTDEQRKEFMKLVNGMLMDVRAGLQDHENVSKTRSQLSDLDDV